MAAAYLANRQYGSNGGTSTIDIILGLALLVGMWMIFVKAERPGWYSIIPFYNYYKLFEVVAGNGWYFLVMAIPLVGNIALGYFTAKAFGKSNGYMIGLMLIPSIFFILLGFGDSEYYGPAGIGDTRTAYEKSAKTVDFDVTKNAGGSTYYGDASDSFESTGTQNVEFDVSRTDSEE